MGKYSCSEEWCWQGAQGGAAQDLRGRWLGSVLLAADTVFSWVT